MPPTDMQVACATVLARLAGHLDRFEYDDFLQLVTPDCIWRGSPDAAGHTAIRARLDARPRDARTLHVLTNTVVDLVEEDRARARSVVTVYRLAITAGLPVAVPATPKTIGLYDDVLTRRPGDGQDGLWRLAERRLTPLAEAGA